MKKITFLFVILLTAMMANVSKVSAQTQLTTPTVGTATLPTSIGFTANWTAVANALSYDVKVYDVTLTLVSTKNVTGATTATAAITGLTASTAYQFTVTAVGDGTIYSNSIESAQSATISTVAAVTLVTPTVGTASRLTLTGFTANWTAVENAISYDVNVYDATNALVTGSPINITGATTATVAINKSGGMLAPNTTYTFTATAKGDAATYFNSIESSKSTSFTTATSGSFVMQYADVDVMTLNTDLKGGAADIYELTTSGGAYTFNTTLGDNNTLVRSTTLRAAAGLAAKPIIKLTTTNTASTTTNMFNTQLANITVTFNGLEFNGINSFAGGSQPTLFYGKNATATNSKVYITNCTIHDFYNGGGNGLIRLDGLTTAAPNALIDIQGSTIYNFSARALFLNGATSGANTASVVNLKNNTFYSNSLANSRANIIYNTSGSGTWSGSITVDHCTFDHIVSTSGTECIIRQNTPATGGTITISNSIFTTIGGAALYAFVTVNNSYLTGFTNAPLGTVTNSFAASPAPAYTDVATNNFKLTNASSFICADGLIAGNTYNVLAIPNVSAGGTRVTLTGFIANWTAVENAISYDVNVYDATNALVTGSPKNVTGTTSATMAITGMLTPNTTYTYSVTAKGDAATYFNSTESSKSTSFTTATSGSFVMQYADVDVMTLNADLKGGAADIYELTTSGGAYTFSTTVGDNNTLVRSTTLRAAAGLAAKPIIKLTSTQGTSGTSNIFNTQAANITVTFIGLEFNGNNTGSVGQPMLFYAKTATSTNCKVFVINCLIHEFFNVSGNGLIRLDGITAAAPTGVIDIQGSTIYNFSARTLYLNPANNVTNAYSVNLKNNTFNTNSIQSSRANIIYSAGGSGSWSGTITIDHCTFNNLVTNGTDCIIRQLTPATGGTITISNSIFTTIGGAALYDFVTANNSYLAGFTNAPLGTVTNSFAASPAPAYTEVATNNFRLTNAGSFICADGFVAGNTYNTLSVPAVSAGGTNVTSGGFTANWAAVVNANSYDVRVYDSAPTQVGTTTNVAAGTLSLAITGLSSNANYTYTVTAIGDHITYFDSNVSAASVPVSTLVTGINRTEAGISVFVNGKTIVASEIGTIQVYNLQGAQLLHIQNVAKVNTNLASGLYVVCFTNKAGKQSIQKIAIQ